MILGMLICVLGAGLVTRLDIDTSTAQWAAFLVLAGAGLGTAMQLPYTAVQIVLRFAWLSISYDCIPTNHHSDADIPTGNGH